jgi:hypothetical protein
MTVLVFDPKYGDEMFLRNVRNDLQCYNPEESTLQKTSIPT